MCNPPFYGSAEEMLASAKAKQRPPLSACTGSEVEMVTPGGEVAFVTRMIQESLTLRDRVEWYTTMVGKLSSVPVIVEKLKSVGVSTWAVTEFVQGSKTRRWGIAWSWGDMQPRMVNTFYDEEGQPVVQTLTVRTGCGARNPRFSKAPLAVSLRIRIQSHRSTSGHGSSANR